MQIKVKPVKHTVLSCKRRTRDTEHLSVKNVLSYYILISRMSTYA